jgi:hypothetical protein
MRCSGIAAVGQSRRTGSLVERIEAGPLGLAAGAAAVFVKDRFVPALEGVAVFRADGAMEDVADAAVLRFASTL